MNARDVGTLAICAVRYALGRGSYMPSEVDRIVRAAGLDAGDLVIIARDIREHAERHGLGDESALWLSLATWCDGHRPA